MKRRTLLKGSLASCIVGSTLSIPQLLQAAWSKSAFEAKTVVEALQILTGMEVHTSSAQIDIRAPEIADNGAVVPVTADPALCALYRTPR